MISLADLQARFQSFLTDGDEGIEALTVGSDRLPAAERLAVYANAYRLRLLEVLAQDFPGVKALAGDEAFDDMGTAYIDAYPSAHPSVRWFGRRFAVFLNETPPYSDRPFLAEMAAFEWRQGEVMDAADSGAVAADELGTLRPEAWPGMTIVFQHALRRLDLVWNVPVVWQAVRESETPPALEAAGQPLPWVLWRRNMQVHWRSLDEHEAYALDAARAGTAFGDICEGLLARTHDDQVPLRAAGFLKSWASDDLVTRVEA